MTIEQMNKEVRDYCLSIIFNSTIEDWNMIKPYQSKQLFKNNIRIVMHDGKSYKHVFTAYIFTDSTFTTKNREIGFEIDWCWNKEQRKERKSIENKWDEINSYFTNKQNYEDALKTYNLLPIKEIRKKKLKNINDIS